MECWQGYDVVESKAVRSLARRMYRALGGHGAPVTTLELVGTASPSALQIQALGVLRSMPGVHAAQAAGSRPGTRDYRLSLVWQIDPAVASLTMAGQR